MPRRDVHAHTVFIAFGNRHQHVSQYTVVLTDLVIRLDVLAELNQVVPTVLGLTPGSQGFGNLQDFLLLRRVKLLDIGNQKVNILV
jgi:cephalosporin-C deacetylase-like acetyl esterase